VSRDWERYAAKAAAKNTRHARKAAAKNARHSAKYAAKTERDALKQALHDAARGAKHAAKEAAKSAEYAAKDAAKSAKYAAREAAREAMQSARDAAGGYWRAQDAAQAQGDPRQAEQSGAYAQGARQNGTYAQGTQGAGQNDAYAQGAQGAGQDGAYAQGAERSGAYAQGAQGARQGGAYAPRGSQRTAQGDAYAQGAGHTAKTAKKLNYTRLAARINARVLLQLALAFIIIDTGLYALYHFGFLSFGEFWLGDIPFGPFETFLLVATLLVLVQVFFLIGSGASVGASVRRNLAPLQDLLSATEAFADASRSPSGRYSPEALKELSRALDAINASHLESRISADAMAEELRPLAVAINEMLARIDEAHSAQKRFVSDASHELRTPIAVIQGYAKLLLRWGSEDPATLRESLEAIKTEADGMKQMVNQLLFLARGDNESMQIDWQAVQLSGVLREVMREARVIAEENLMPEGREGLPEHRFEEGIVDGLVVYGDAGLLKQLVRILLDNSIKYSAAGGVIRVRLAPDGFGRAQVTVSDEGAGIPEDILPHIFDRFVRADESRTRGAGGAGLGLAIAKWIAERHGGYIEVVSSEGIGSRFTVSLPLIQ
jgi:signal transduction histidine kinase